MTDFVTYPNLPNGDVSAVILGGRYDNIAAALERQGIQTIMLPANTDISQQIHFHADMSAYYCGKGELILSKSIYEQCCSLFPNDLQIYTAVLQQNENYPFDISLNACEIGNYIICRKAHTDPAILLHAQNQNKTIIDVKQGYSRCSICVLDETHIITADKAVSEALRGYNIESLLIRPGFFRLPGYEYGFIGGSCFKLSANTIAFTGTLSGHPDEQKILDYIDELNMNAVFLTAEQCFDIGSAIPLIEER